MGRWPALAGVSLGYGVLCGCGVGMAYTALLGYSAAWFPDWPGLGSAIYAGCEAILLPYAWAFSP